MCSLKVPGVCLNIGALPQHEMSSFVIYSASTCRYKEKQATAAQRALVSCADTKHSRRQAAKRKLPKDVVKGRDARRVRGGPQKVTVGSPVWRQRVPLLSPSGATLTDFPKCTLIAALSVKLLVCVERNSDVHPSAANNSFSLLCVTSCN